MDYDDYRKTKDPGVLASVALQHERLLAVLIALSGAFMACGMRGMSEYSESLVFAWRKASAYRNALVLMRHTKICCTVLRIRY